MEFEWPWECPCLERALVAWPPHLCGPSGGQVGGEGLAFLSRTCRVLEHLNLS